MLALETFSPAATAHRLSRYVGQWRQEVASFYAHDLLSYGLVSATSGTTTTKTYVEATSVSFSSTSDRSYADGGITSSNTIDGNSVYATGSTVTAGSAGTTYTDWQSSSFSARSDYGLTSRQAASSSGNSSQHGTLASVSGSGSFATTVISTATGSATNVYNATATLHIAQGTASRFNALQVVTVDTSTREAVSFSQNAGGHTDTFLTTVTDSFATVTFLDSSVVGAGTGSTPATYAAASTSLGATGTLTRASYTNGQGFDTLLLLNHGSPNQEIAWVLTVNAGGEAGFSAWQGSTAGKFTELYASHGGSVVTLQSKYALVDVSYTVPLLYQSFAYVGTVLNTYYGTHNVTNTVNSRVTVTHSFDIGVGSTYSVQLPSYVDGTQFSVDTASSTAGAGSFSFTRSVYEDTVTTTTSMDSFATVPVPYLYSIYSSFTYDSGFGVDTTTVFVGLDYTNLVSMEVVPYVTTAPARGVLTSMLSYTLDYTSTYTVAPGPGVTGGSHTVVTNVSYGGACAMTYHGIERVAPRVASRNHHNLAWIMDSVFAVHSQMPAGYAGFMGTTSGNYDGVVVGYSVTGAVVAGTHFGVSLSLSELAVSGAQYLDEEVAVSVVALDSGRRHTFAGGEFSVGSIAGLASSVLVYATHTSTTTRLHRIESTTFSWVTYQTAHYRFQLDQTIQHHLQQRSLNATNSNIFGGIDGTMGGVAKADGPATVYANYPYVTYWLYGSGDSVHGAPVAVEGAEGTVSFAFPANSAIRISAEPRYTVAYYGRSDRQFYLADQVYP